MPLGTVRKAKIDKPKTSLVQAVDGMCPCGGQVAHDHEQAFIIFYRCTKCGDWFWRLRYGKDDRHAGESGRAGQ